MADKKEQKDSKDQGEPKAQNLSDEIVGLEDEAACPNSVKKSLIGKFTSLKRYMIPAGIAIGASAITIVLFLLFSGSPKNETDSASLEESSVEQTAVSHESSAEQTDHQNNDATDEHAVSNESHQEPAATEPVKDHQESEQLSDSYLDSLNSIDFQPVDLSKYGDIDTMQIMEELSFLYATPEDEFADDGLTPEDSVDTLNWLEKRMLELSNKETELIEREQSVKKMEKRVEVALTKINQAESSRITNLARLYDSMKPDEVAKLFASLSDEVVISLIPRMKPANAAKILALMPSKRAAKLSTQMITVLEN
ncbi:MAG: hypothetical protein ABIJ45_12215 [Candidatus Zixiibacteriota bacterium]